MRIAKKKIVGAVAISAVVAMGAGTAFAFWTSSGEGTGSATAGTDEEVTVHQTSTSSGFTINGSSVPLSGNFDNPNPFPVALTTVTATLTGVTGGAQDGSKPACTIADFAITGTGVVTGGEVISGTGVGEWTGLNIALNPKPRLVNGVFQPQNNQDNCKNATVLIDYDVA